MRQWTSSRQDHHVSLGYPVDQANAKALVLRRASSSGLSIGFNIHDVSIAPDVFHAASRSLVEECSSAPESTLQEASQVWKLLQSTSWGEDPLCERDDLLNILALTCWRAARLLRLYKTAYSWEVEYLASFSKSSDRQAALLACTGEVATLERCSAEEWEAEDFFAALQYLHERRDSNPDLLLTRGAAIYNVLLSRDLASAADMRPFLSGFAAQLAGMGSRLVGSFPAAQKWFDRAETHFKDCNDESALIARLDHQRLCLLYSLGRINSVVELAPALEAMFDEFGMSEDRFRCRIVWAACLKSMGECDRAAEALEPLLEKRAEISSALYAWVLNELGDIHLINGEYEKGFGYLRVAVQLFQDTNQMAAWSTALTVIAFGYRKQGLFPEAIEIYRKAQVEAASRNMKPSEGYIRLLITETYAAAGQWRAAEQEALAILPIFETHGMVAEGVAAIRFLRECLRRQKADPLVHRE